MSRAALVRLAAASVAAAGAVAGVVALGAGHPEQASTTEPGFQAATTGTSTGTGTSGAGARGATGASRTLTAHLPAPADSSDQSAQDRAAQDRAAWGAVVDESKPHTHVVDPRTGGLVSVAGARGVVGDAEQLGAVHVDPLPAGVSLDDPTDTGTLFERAAADETTPDGALSAGSISPVGTPGIRTLSAHVTPSCSGSGTDGNRVQVLYVHEAGVASRLSSVLPVIRNEIANVDDVFALSAQQTGGQRRVRWVHDADCAPVVKNVTLPTGALGSDFWATVKAVKAAGYADPHRKYLMFADASKLCGIGTLYDDPSLTRNANDGANASYARVDATCWSSSHSVPAHELTHTLGSVLSTAPHATTNGHCYDESDLMCYDDGSGIAMQKVCASAQEQLLDCGHNDYFSTKPPAGSFLAKHWNTASSSFLDDVVVPPPAPPVTLTAAVKTARTGKAVALTATSTRPVTWRWSTSASACTTSSTVSGRATLVCPSTVTGAVVVTATATDASTAAKGAGKVTVTMTRAPAPGARLTLPASATAGTAFTAQVAATGTGTLSYTWDGGRCTVTGSGAKVAVTCPAATSASSATSVGSVGSVASVTSRTSVGVLVTQADGQRVRALAGVPVSTAATGLSPAVGQEPLTSTPATVVWGTTTRASGTLTTKVHDSSGAALAGLPVTLQARWTGTSSWVAVRSTSTDTLGRAVLRPTYPRAGSFRLVAADPDWTTNPSVGVAVAVAPRIAMSGPSAHRLTGTLSTASGARIPGLPVLLERKAPGHAWTRVVTLRSSSAGAVSRVVRPSVRTSYRWVVRASSTVTAATSATRTLR